MDSISKKVLARIDEERGSDILKNRIDLISKEKNIPYVQVRRMFIEEYAKRDSRRCTVLVASPVTVFFAYRLYVTREIQGFIIASILFSIILFVFHQFIYGFIFTEKWEDRT